MGNIFLNNNNYNGTVNCIIGNNVSVVTKNGVIVSVNGVSADSLTGETKQIKRSFECTASEEADTLVFTGDNNCTSLSIIADESIDKVSADVQAFFIVPKGKKNKKALESFNVEAVVGTVGTDRVVYFRETNPCSEKINISTAYKVRVSKSVKNIIVKLSIGDVSVKDFEGKATILMTTGDVSVKNCTLCRSKIETTTGNINFADNTVNNEIDVSATTGNIKLSVNGGNGAVTAKTTTGEIYLMNDDFDDYRTVKTSLTGKAVFAEVNGCFITASTTVGNVN